MNACIELVRLKSIFSHLSHLYYNLEVTAATTNALNNWRIQLFTGFLQQELIKKKPKPEKANRLEHWFLLELPSRFPWLD